MIVCKEIPGRQFSTQTEMFKTLVDYKPQLIALKKSVIKFSDETEYGAVQEITDKGDAVKANNPVTDPDITELKVKVVMNTTNLLDSHGDVHIKDIWKRTLDHNNRKLHLQEHKKSFDAVISDDAEAYTKTVRWKTLGYEFEGSTQALMFDSLVKQSRNPLMFNQYKNGWVKQHSVGMQYVDIVMCMNSGQDWAKEYMENWEKYYPLVANKEDADARGYFWAVTEAKLMEGSAVLLGSNWATPTLDNNMKFEQSPSDEQKDDSPSGTHTEQQKEFINVNLY